VKIETQTLDLACREDTFSLCLHQWNDGWAILYHANLCVVLGSPRFPLSEVVKTLNLRDISWFKMSASASLLVVEDVLMLSNWNHPGVFFDSDLKIYGFLNSDLRFIKGPPESHHKTSTETPIVHCAFFQDKLYHLLWADNSFSLAEFTISGTLKEESLAFSLARMIPITVPEFKLPSLQASDQIIWKFDFSLDPNVCYVLPAEFSSTSIIEAWTIQSFQPGALECLVFRRSPCLTFPDRLSTYDISARLVGRNIIQVGLYF